MNIQQATSYLSEHGQAHVLAWFDQLSADEQAALLAQVAELDFARLTAQGRSVERERARVVEPYREVVESTDERNADARALGRQALSEGRVGVVLVAGGQGTRLGFEGPKGAFPLGAVSGRTLFQIHADTLRAVAGRYGAQPPLYVMTSPANHEQTKQLWMRNEYYGLDSARVRIFPQAELPVMDSAGRLLMASRGRIVFSPNGNGGLFGALRCSGSLSHMHGCGVDTVSYIQVDNGLAQSCDPLFLGHHLLASSEFSCKAIAKLDAFEKVGNFACVDGRLAIIEYTEIPDDLATKSDQSGRLLFGYGNPGLFVWSRGFLERQADREDLPFHRAHKKVAHIDAQGSRVEPQAPNAYKLECFALDTLPDAKKAMVLACERNREFAPVKNASGVDSPASARRLMSELYGSWVQAAGGELAEGVQLEISPRFAIDAQELADKWDPSRSVQRDTFIE